MRTQPANIAVQDELRRLYGRRDGVEPPKLKLSRGALVRMYARGGLNRQAIAEIRAALVEDPQRIDLEVILAKIHHILGEKVEAVEIASRLVLKLPYCFEVNQILADILPTTAHAQDAQACMERLLALDPYLAYLSSSTPTSHQVPDNAVMIDRLEWQPSEGTQEQPVWAQTLGVHIDESIDSERPEWLTEVPETDEGVAAGAESDMPAAVFNFPDQSDTQISTEEGTPVEAELPEWMRDAGWAVTNQPQINSSQPIITGDEEPSPEDEPAKAELPEWIKDMAPDALESDIPIESEQEQIDLLNKIFPPAVEQSGDQPEPDAELTASNESPIESAIMPDWLREFSAEHLSGESQPQTSVEPISESVEGEWFSSQTNLETEVPVENAEVEATNDDLKVISEEMSEVSVISAAELPTPMIDESEIETPGDDWLKSLQAFSETPEVESIAESEDKTTEQISEDKKSETTDESWFATVEASPELTAQIPPESQSLPDWLNEFEIPAIKDSVITTEFQSESQVNEPVGMTSSEELPPASEISSGFTETTDSLTTIEAPVDEAISGENEPVQTEPTIEIPNMEEFEPVISDVNTIAESQEIAIESELESPAIELPELEKRFEAEGEQAVAAEAIEFQSGQESEFVADNSGLPDLSDADAAMAWLEALAAKQGADEETLITPPDERLEAPPGWIHEAQEQFNESLAGVDNVSQSEIPSLPAELMSEGEESTSPIMETEDMPVSQITEDEVNLDILSKHTNAVSPLDEPIAEDITPLPDGFEESVRPIEKNIVEEQNTALEPLTGGSSLDQPPAEMDFDAAFAWLESLAAQQGAAAETLITTPQERIETPPTWVIESTSEETESPTQPVKIYPDKSSVETPQSVTSEVQETTPILSEIPPVIEDSETVELENQLVGEETADYIEKEIPGQVTQTEKHSAFEQGVESEEARLPQTSSLQPLPDWLKGMDTEPVPVASSDMPESPELPDWLRGLENPVAESEESNPATSTSGPLPDWINNQTPTQETDIERHNIPDQAAESGAVPAWLQELEDNQPAAALQDESPAGEILTSENIAQYDEQETIPSGTESHGMLLNQAQTTLASGKVEISMRYYSRLIQNGLFIEETIHDLRDALYRFPVDISIWQTLGDAFLRNNQIQEALDAYTKAEEFLR